MKEYGKRNPARDIRRWDGEALTKQARWRVTRNDEGDRVLKGKYGVISVYPDGDLDVWATSPIVAGRIERGGWKAKQHFDDGAFFVRPFSDLDRAARFIKAGKRRQVTDAMREAGRQMAARMRSLRKNPLYRSTAAAESPKNVPMPKMGGQSPDDRVLVGAGTGAAARD